MRRVLKKSVALALAILMTIGLLGVNELSVLSQASSGELYSTNTYTVTFKNYNVPAEGAAVVKPEEAYDYESGDYKFGEEIVFPEAPVFNEHHTFLGWSTVEGDANSIVYNMTMPAENVTLYAVYERTKVMLVKKNETCTTVIDRSNATVDDYEDGVSEWYVYGLREKIVPNILLHSYIDVQGDGRIEIEYVKTPDGTTFEPYTGTGTAINVYNNVANNLVESFHVVVFGDVDGDSLVNSTDEYIVEQEVLGNTKWSLNLEENEEYDPTKVFASDLNHNGIIDSEDVQIIRDHILGIIEINQTSDNYPEINADESESPADRTAYQGVFEDYVTAVVINGDGNWISDIIVDGNKYHIKKGLISFSEADSILNKDVIFVVKDGEVVYFSKAEDITVKTVLGLSGDNTLNYGYLGDNAFSKNSIKLGLRIHNLIAAPAPADFVSSEEQKKNLAAIGKLESLKVYISNVTLTSDPENIFNFSGKKSVQIPVDRYLSAGGTLTTEVPVNVNSKYKPKEYKYHACIAGKLAFKKGEVSDTSESNFYITVCNYNLDPNKPTKNNSTTSDENNQLAKKAASELNKVQSGSNQGAISLTGSADLVELIGFKNIKAIEEKLFAIICLTHIPKEKIEETLSDKVISKVFGAKKWFCLNTKEIQLEVAVNTKYGEIVLKLTSEYPEYNFNGYNLGGLGQVEYELSGKGAKKLPKDFPKTGFAGFFTSVDVTAFCNAAYSFVESELKKSYNLAYGNNVNKAVDFIFGKSVNKILKYTKYGSASGLVWKALTVAGKEYKIECPVDVFVYDSDGNLVASIENNIETLSSENVEIEINGDTKYVRLFDGSYKIVYKATANGSMRVTVNEMANLDTSLRTVVIDDVPLSAGVSYSQNSDGKILEESDYALTANDGTVYNADSDTVNFHDHISNGVWYDGDSSTCTEKGWKCSICTVCNEWFKEYFDLAEHSDNDGNGYCDDCGAITAVSSFAIRKPSTTTVNYGDSIILHADIDGTLPASARIEWTASNGNFSMSVSADGTTCKISPKSNGKTVFTATVYDKDGNVISSDTQEMTAKAGLWQKIVAFFKKIFGLTKTFPEAFKGIL